MALISWSLTLTKQVNKYQVGADLRGEGGGWKLTVFDGVACISWMWILFVRWIISRWILEIN